MTDVKEGVIDRVKDHKNWIRVFFMIAYGIVLLYVVVPVVAVVMVAQILFMFSLGKLNSNLTAFGESLVEYIQEIIGFLFFKLSSSILFDCNKSSTFHCKLYLNA